MNARKVCLNLAVALALTAGVALAQPEVEWERTYGGALIDEGTSVIQMDDAGYVISGFSGSSPSGRANLWLIYTSENGDSLWTRTFSNLESGFGSKIIRMSDNGIAIGATIFNRSNENYLDYWLTVLDSNGDSLWTRTYGNEGFMAMEMFEDLVQTQDGGFILIGSANLEDDDICLVKTDSTGELEWSRRYGGDDFDIGMSVIQTEDGGYAITGQTRSFGAGYYDVWLLRTDESGDSLWSRTFGGEEEDAGVCVVETTDGGFFIAGATKSFSAGNSDCWIIRTSENGDSLWSSTFGGSEAEGIRTCLQTSDGGFILGGYTSSFGAGNGDYLLVRTDENGDSLWACTFGGERSEWCHDLVMTPDGGYALAGWTESFRDQTHDFYLVKTTPDPVSVRDPGSNLNPLTFNLFPAYPNPFNSTVTISFGLDKSAPTRLAIFDPLGRKVTDLTNSAFRIPNSALGTVFWDASGVPAGQYIVRLESGNQQLSQRLSLVK